MVSSFMFAVLGLAFSALVYAITSTILGRCRQRAETVRRAVLVEIGSRIMQDSYWFSQDDMTSTLLLQRIAWDLMHGGESEIEKVREEWYEWRKEAQNRKDEIK